MLSLVGALHTRSPFHQTVTICLISPLVDGAPQISPSIFDFANELLPKIKRSTESLKACGFRWNTYHEFFYFSAISVPVGSPMLWRPYTLHGRGNPDCEI